MADYAALQDEHQRLLHLLDAKTDAATLVPAVRAYLARAQAESSSVAAPRDRDQLRANLRFWASYLFDHTGAYPDTTLRPVEPGHLESVPIEAAPLPPGPPPQPQRSWLVWAAAAAGLVLLGVCVVAGLVSSSAYIVRAVPSATATIRPTSTKTPVDFHNGGVTPDETEAAATALAAATSTPPPPGTATADATGTQLSSIQQTQAAIQASVATATATNTPNLTATAAACTYDYQLTSQQPEDGQTLATGANVTKMLTILNSGLCAFPDGTVLSETSNNLAGVQPITVSLPVIAPNATGAVSFGWPGRKTSGSATRTFVLLSPDRTAIGQPLTLTLKYGTAATPLPTPTSTPPQTATSVAANVRLQFLAKVSQASGAANCSSRSLIVTVDRAGLPAGASLNDAQAVLTRIGGDTVVTAPLAEGQVTLDLAKLDASKDRTLLLQVDDPRLTFAGVILQFSPDCSQNQVAVNYVAVQAPSLIPNQPPQSPNLSLAWILNTWGPDPLDPQRWVAQLQLVGQGGDGAFIFWDGQTPLPGGSLLLAQQGCDPARRVVGVSSGGEAVLVEIVLQAPVCR